MLEVCATDAPDLVLIDLVAPRGHGFDVCRQLKEQTTTRFIPVVIVTSQSDRADRLSGIEAGCDDFLNKPFDPVELHARIQSLVRLKRYTDELESAEVGDSRPGRHHRGARSRRPTGTASGWRTTRRKLGISLGLDAADLGALERGGFLHDIGKIAVPDSVLLKDGKLDPQESRVMRKHPIVGDSLCAGLRSLNKVRPIVRHHHERLDGTGYPDGLRNGEVPLLAQIVSIVDVFDALTTERPYRNARPLRGSVSGAGRRSVERMARSGAGRRVCRDRRFGFGSPLNLHDDSGSTLRERQGIRLAGESSEPGRRRLPWR